MPRVTATISLPLDDSVQTFTAYSFRRRQVHFDSLEAQGSGSHADVFYGTYGDAHIPVVIKVSFVDEEFEREQTNMDRMRQIAPRLYTSFTVKSKSNQMFGVLVMERVTPVPNLVVDEEFVDWLVVAFTEMQRQGIYNDDLNMGSWGKRDSGEWVMLDWDKTTNSYSRALMQDAFINAGLDPELILEIEQRVPGLAGTALPQTPSPSALVPADVTMAWGQVTVTYKQPQHRETFKDAVLEYQVDGLISARSWDWTTSGFRHDPGYSDDQVMLRLLHGIDETQAEPVFSIGYNEKIRRGTHGIFLQSEQALARFHSNIQKGVPTVLFLHSTC